MYNGGGTRTSIQRAGIAALGGRLHKGTAVSKKLCLCVLLLGFSQTRNGLDKAVKYNGPGRVKLDLHLETLGWFFEAARDFSEHQS